MSSTHLGSGSPAGRSAPTVQMRLEVAVLPVSDVGRARDFYAGLGWRLDADVTVDDFYRVVQLTPPGSPASIIVGKRVTTMAPGSVQDLMLVVDNIGSARDALIGQGVQVGEIWHDETGIFHHAGIEGRVSGPDPDGSSYGSFASFSDPDGNGWHLQEIKERLPGRT